MAAERPAVEPWLPHQYKWTHVAMLGLITGILGAYIFAKTGSLFLPFGISAASLLFLNLGVEKFPVTHHMTLPATFVASMAMTDGASVLVALGLGAFFGILGALFGEVYQRIFYAHSDTHFDPPAASIITTTSSWAFWHWLECSRRPQRSPCRKNSYGFLFTGPIEYTHDLISKHGHRSENQASTTPER